MLFCSPWWEAGQRRRQTYTASSSPTGNHKHQPAAKHLIFIVTTPHHSTSQYALFVLLPLTTKSRWFVLSTCFRNLCPMPLFKWAPSIRPGRSATEIYPIPKENMFISGEMIRLKYPQTVFPYLLVIFIQHFANLWFQSCDCERRWKKVKNEYKHRIAHIIARLKWQCTDMGILQSRGWHWTKLSTERIFQRLGIWQEMNKHSALRNAVEAKAELHLLLLSPNKADVSNEFQVQSYVFCLAPSGLKCSVQGSSCSSFGHYQTITLNVQFALRSGKKGMAAKWQHKVKSNIPALQGHASLWYPQQLLTKCCLCQNQYSALKSYHKICNAKVFHIPSILPSSAVTVIPMGAEISLSFPISPLSARTLTKTSKQW